MEYRKPLPKKPTTNILRWRSEISRKRYCFRSRSTARHLLALAALPLDDPRFAWLQSSGAVRVTILAELGRLGDSDLIRQLALKICEARMTTRTAVRALRKIRGVKLPATGHGAANAIITALNNYLRTHPDTTDDQLIDAVRVVLATLEARKGSAK